MSYVYILESIKDSRYYIGSTIDLKKRFLHHKSGGTPSTKKFGGIKLIFSQEFNTLKEARYIERRLKKLKRKDYLRKIINDGFIKIKYKYNRRGSSVVERNPEEVGVGSSILSRGTRTNHILILGEENFL